MEPWLAAALIVLLASSLQAATGFGFSVMATPFLLLVYPAHAAVQINIILSLLISLIMVPRVGGDIDRPLLLRLVKGAVFGAPVGLAVFVFLDAGWLKLVAGIFILSLTALLVLQATVKQSAVRDGVAGGLSGVLTASLGMPGPPLLLYFAGTGMDRSILRATTLAFFLFAYSASLVLQIVVGAATADIWLKALALSPVAVAGVMLGQLLFRWINQQAFRVITYLILGITGVHLLRSAL